MFHRGTVYPRKNRNKTKFLLALKCSLEDFTQEGHKCPKCQFPPTEKVCNVFNKLGDLDKSLEHDTKSALANIAGYVSRHDDKNIVIPCFIMKNLARSPESYLNRGKFNILGDSVCQRVFFFLHRFSRGFRCDL